MFRTLSAIAFAMLVGGALTMISHVQASAPAPFAKGDRHETATCERQGWPYYETSCLRDASKNAGRGHGMRIISTDRIALPVHIEAANSKAANSPYPPAWLAWLPGSLPVDENAAIVRAILTK